MAHEKTGITEMQPAGLCGRGVVLAECSHVLVHAVAGRILVSYVLICGRAVLELSLFSYFAYRLP
jgi:hypothetical protein